MVFISLLLGRFYDQYRSRYCVVITALLLQPDGISQLVNLEELRLDSNNLSELPSVSLLVCLLAYRSQLW